MKWCKRNRRGSAILSVTLLGLLILAISTALVSITTTFNQRSFAANKQIVCRYAAEGALERIKYRIRLEDASEASGGWFDLARTAPDPVETMTIGSNADAANVAISIYDPTEASSALGVALGADEYIVEARATSGGNASTLQMRVKYKVETITTTTTTPNPQKLFSKYSFWNNTGGGLVPGRFGGYIHFNGNLTVNSPSDRFALPVTATGTVTWQANPPWQHFDWNGNGILDTAERPEFGGYSEERAYYESGGNKPSVEQPSYQDVSTTLKEVAATQRMANPALSAFDIDSDNPLYSGLGTLLTSSITFAHTLNSSSQNYQKTVATIQVTGSMGSVTHTVVVPPGTPVIVYSTPRISSLRGTVYGQVTVASAFKGTPTYVSYAGQTILWPPAIQVTGHLIQVDKYGRPKYWMYRDANGDGIYSQSEMMSRPSSLALTGPPISSSGNVDNSTANWTTANRYNFLRNPAYESDMTDPAKSQPTSLGVIGVGDVVYATSARNIMWNGAMYAADTAARVSTLMNPSWTSSQWSSENNSRTNWCQAGSRITPQFGLIGPPYENTFRPYDEDLLTTPPPYWIAPAGVTTTTTTTTAVTASLGTVYDRIKRY